MTEGDSPPLPSPPLPSLPSPPLPSPPLPPLPPLTSPPLPSLPSLPLVTQRIHSPFQPKQSPSYGRIRELKYPYTCGWYTRSEKKTVVVSMGRIRDPKSVRLKDRDYDVTAYIFLILSLTCTPKSVMGRWRSARWRWSAKSARCTVKMVGEECSCSQVMLAASLLSRHVKASYLLRVRNLELRVLKIAISSL